MKRVKIGGPIWHRVPDGGNETICATGWTVGTADQRGAVEDTPVARLDRCAGCYAEEELAEASLAEYAETIQSLQGYGETRTRLAVAASELAVRSGWPGTLTYQLLERLLPKAVAVEAAGEELAQAVWGHANHHGRHEETFARLRDAVQRWEELRESK